MIVSDLPWNDEAEKNLLSILMHPSGNAAAIMDKLTAEEKITENDFYGTYNKNIFKAIQQLCAKGEIVDISTIANKLNWAGDAQSMSELKYIALLMPTTTAAAYYAKMLRELTQRRAYISMAQRVAEVAGDTSQSFDEISAEIEKAIEQNADSEMCTLKELMVDAYTDIVNRFSAPNRLSGLPTEWKDINKLTGGFGRGELIIIGGRPGMGKSIAGQNIAYHTACVLKKKTIVFTLEMSRIQLAKRILSAQTGTAYSKYKTGDVDGDDFMKLGYAMESEGIENLMVNDTPRATVEYIKSQCRTIKRQIKEIGVVVIDYIGLMSLPSNSRSRWEGVGEISRELKILAKELDCPIVVLSQITRTVEKERDKRPKLSDLRESGSLEQDADVVLLLYRDEYYYPNTTEKGVVEMIVAKARDSKTGTVKLSWQPQIMRIMDFAEVRKLKQQAEKFRLQKYGEQMSVDENKKEE